MNNRGSSRWDDRCHKQYGLHNERSVFILDAALVTYAMEYINKPEGRFFSIEEGYYVNATFAF
jgi:hypothetical protein